MSTLKLSVIDINRVTKTASIWSWLTEDSSSTYSHVASSSCNVKSIMPPASSIQHSNRTLTAIWHDHNFWAEKNTEMHTDTHSATEHIEVDSDYTTHDSLQGPDFPLTGVLTKCIQVHPISSHTRDSCPLKFFFMWIIHIKTQTLYLCVLTLWISPELLGSSDRPVCGFCLCLVFLCWICAYERLFLRLWTNKDFMESKLVAPTNDLQVNCLINQSRCVNVYRTAIFSKNLWGRSRRIGVWVARR